MLASIPVSMLNQSRPDLGIPNRINLTSSRSSFCVTAGSDVNQGAFPMTFVGRLSVVTAYVAFAFVGAIVLGVF
jgi:hypothetical protein